jgi:uncharacterized membrane protein YtjA (UPF0391 family)
MKSKAHNTAWARCLLCSNNGPENRLAANVSTTKEVSMFSWALMFLVIALIAALFGFTGIAGTATNIAWILFVVGIVLAIVFAIAGRRPSV